MLGVEGRMVLVRKKPVSETQSGFVPPAGSQRTKNALFCSSLHVEFHLLCGECMQTYLLYHNPHFQVSFKL